MKLGAVLVTDDRYPSGHVVAPRNRARIRCLCGAPAERCEYMRWSCGPGLSFFYHCSRCWIVEGPDGRSPRDRAWDRPSPRRAREAS